VQARSAHTAYWRLRWAGRTLRTFRQRVEGGGVPELIRDRLAAREQNFLWTAEHLIFANPNSPYRPLLDLAGYDLPKLRQLVFSSGLDQALDQLCRDGVYVRVQEFKGVEPIVRRGRTLRVQAKDFVNPSARGVLHRQSGGSRSSGTVTSISMESLLDNVRLRRWMLERYGLLDRDVVVWSTYLSGLNSTVMHTMMGRPPRRWFSLSGRGVVPGATSDGAPATSRPISAQGDWATTLLVMAARMMTGLPVPRPVEMPADRVVEVARAISEMRAPQGILVKSFVNPALSLVLAADEAGLNLGDVAFLVGGEPLTPAKRRQFEDRGFKVYSNFGFSEFGGGGWLCPLGTEADDMHVLTDRVALRQYSRVVDRDGDTVPAYLFTGLLPHMRNVALNLESGDYGGLEERRCGCFLEEAGLRLHMHTVRSFEKLTAEGMAFIGPALINLLEETLPREFGGDGRHYQLVEGEDGQGRTRVFVLVSPQLGGVDEDAVRRTVLREIGGTHLSTAEGALIQQIWDRANTVQVLRREPLATSAGKIMHLHRDRGELRSAGNGQR